MLKAPGLAFGVPSKGVRDDVQRFIMTRAVAVHESGHIILSPPGSGKTHFAERHPDFVDVDEFLGDFLRFHTEDWTKQTHTSDEEQAHYEKCDVYLAAMCEAGLWVVGSLFWDYVPDAIVIIDKDLHREFVDRRPDLSWKDADKVRRFLLDLAKHHPEVQVLREWAAVGPRTGVSLTHASVYDGGKFSNVTSKSVW
jgi:hypothetical protein